jgi:hypothetical protein
MHQHVAAGQQARELALVALERHDGDVGRARQLGDQAAAAGQDQVIALAQLAHRLDQHVQLLLGGEAAGVDQQAGLGVEAEMLAQGFAQPLILAGRMEDA